MLRALGIGTLSLGLCLPALAARQGEREGGKPASAAPAPEPFSCVPKGKKADIPVDPDPALRELEILAKQINRGSARAIAPFLAHWHEAVVRRAVELLCEIGGDEARRAVLELLERFPCREFVLRAAGRLGRPDDQSRVLKRFTARCRRPEPGRSLRVSTLERRALEKIGGARVEALARRLSSGDEQAFREAFRAQGAMDRRCGDEAAAALARIDSPRGWLKLFRGYRQAAGDEWSGGFARLAFSQGVGLAALIATAGRQGCTPGEAFLRLLPQCEEAQHGDLFFFARVNGEVWPAVEKRAIEARKHKRPSGLPQFFADATDEDWSMTHPREYAEVSDRLEACFQKRDRACLHAACDDESGNSGHRLLAASYLAQLGDASKLDIFAAFSSRLGGFMRKAAFDELSFLEKETRGEVRAKVQEILKLYAGTRHPAEGVLHPRVQSGQR
ncbi:MAG: hypothetical protein JXR96_19365 [Deltaproteobacteria bacterium]|nr:hypothetical protein [Deltaproteobacteria bacterium]